MTSIPDFPDLSHWDDANVSYHDMAAAGIKLCILKATQAADNVDQTYQDAYTRVKSVGMASGSYAFIEPNEAGADMVHYESIAHLTSGDLQPIVDAEAAGLTKETTFAAMEDLQAKGFEPILYCSFAFWRDILGSPTQYTLWLADYNTYMPVMPAAVKLFAWQYTQSGHCPGVPAQCDMNKFLGGDLSKFLIP